MSSFSPPSPSLGNPKRHSQPTQLPLPPTLNAVSAHRPQGGTTVSGPGTPTSTTFHTRASSIQSGRDHHNFNHHSPTLSTFPPIPQSPTHSSSTHAGGIQPPASFFRPSRPNQHIQHSRTSEESSSNGLQLNAPDPDLFQLAPLTRQTSRSSEGPSGSVAGEPESVTEHVHKQPYSHPSFKWTKQSREPLLPIGGRPTGLSARPSTARERSATSSIAASAAASSPPTSSGLPPTSPTRNRLMRNSFERVFSLTRGLSLDSIRRSSNTPPASADSRPTLESNDSIRKGKLTDEEQGELYAHTQHSKPPSSPITLRHKTSSSPSPVPRQSLGLVTATRHSHSSRVHHSAASSPSPDPSAFISSAPKVHPPLHAVPATDPITNKPVRRYQRHPARNRFALGGRLLTGGDSPWAFVASFGLVLIIAGVWFGTTAVWWWANVGGGGKAVTIICAYLSLLTISSMLTTATRDPGILPRDLDPDPPYHSSTTSKGDVRVPMPRDLKVRSDVVRVKYCPTCKIYRPPRSSHCKVCDNCVDGCDHHCQWVNNCVGRRNYTSFFVLLMSATTALILIIITTALHLYFITNPKALHGDGDEDNGMNLRHALSTAPGSAIGFSLSILVIWPVAALLSYHMRLLLLNVTTIEQIRNQAYKSKEGQDQDIGPPPNPFSHGNWRRNVLAVLCRPAGSSWLDARGVVTEDRREVNPGMLGLDGTEGWQDRGDE
ncbi:DHHC palmitoyltransferase-domain-containing protein [Infundibulicybe gibba]|nr:DHHC palmitoyltransferase-domain-containing protein [Infundibulicybe gibba]